MVKRVLTPLTLFSLFSPGIGRRPRHCAGLWASDWLMPRAKQKAWRSNTARPRDWSENTRAGFYPNISLTMWNITSTSLGLHCARWQNHICPPRFWLKLFSERMRGRKEKRIWGEKWRSEISSTGRQLKDCKARWDFSVLYGFISLGLPFLCSHCFTLFITDSTAGGERAGQKEPLYGRFSHR